MRSDVQKLGPVFWGRMWCKKSTRAEEAEIREFGDRERERK